MGHCAWRPSRTACATSDGSRAATCASSAVGRAATRLAAADGGEIERVVEEFARAPNGGLIVLPDITTTNHRDLIIALAQRHRLPAIYPFRYFAVSGGLMSYGTDIGDVLRRAAG